jgi:hypothetical protein
VKNNLTMPSVSGTIRLLLPAMLRRLEHDLLAISKRPSESYYPSEILIKEYDAESDAIDTRD